MAHPFVSGYLLFNDQWLYFTQLTALNEFLDRNINGFPVDSFNGKPFCRVLPGRPATVEYNGADNILTHDFPWQHFLFTIERPSDLLVAQQALFEQFYGNQPIKRQ